MSGLLRIIIIFFIVYYIFKLFTRYILPALLGNFIKSRMSEMNKHNNQKNESSKRKEGETVIDSASQQNKKHYPKNTGEYIDFEEIK